MMIQDKQLTEQAGPLNKSPLEIARLVEFGEAEAFAQLYEGIPASFGWRVERIGSAVALIAPHVPVILFNRVIGLGLVEPVTEAIVDTIISLYQNANAPTFAIQLSPEAQPSHLPDWLQTRGMPRRDNWAKVYRAAAPLPDIPTDLRIERIDAQQAETFASVAAAAFEVPPFLAPILMTCIGHPDWRHYLAFDGETAVAAAALRISGKVGWLGMGSTLPSHRRRGAQAALMVRRIRDAIALGCEWLVTETGEDTPERPNSSYHNMLRTGFQLAYQRPNYIM